MPNSIVSNAINSEPVALRPLSDNMAMPDNISSNMSAKNKPTQTRWQRIRQYQPSNRLVRLLFAWWLVVVVVTTLKFTDGLGIALLDDLIGTLFMLCGASLIALVIACVLDWLWLVAISQASHYHIVRKYPSNVPIYHELTIKAYLSFYPLHDGNIKNKNSFANRLYRYIHNMNLIKSIKLDFSDDYPDQLMPLSVMAGAGSAAGTAMTIPVVLKGKDNQQDSVEEDENSVTAEELLGIGANSNSVEINYPVMPIQRGTGYFGSAYLRIWSPFRLIHRRLTVDDSTNQRYLRVLADFSGLLNNQLAAVFEKSPQAGLQTLLQQGHGSDFLNLREYAVGDAIRQIDWKASARHRRLMSKAYEDDNDQEVVFLLDCGEQMRHQNDDSNPENTYNKQGSIVESVETDDVATSERQVNYFDKVLNAVLLLSYVANKQSDSVGLMTFGGVDTYLPPKKGVTLIRNLLNETADIKPTMQTSDYLLAAQTLNRHLKKRSLIILITNTRAEASNELTQAVRLLARKHQIVFANLTEQIVHDRLHGDIIPTQLDDSLLYHSLFSYERSRLQLHQKLAQQTGALCLHTTANRLPATLTQAYLSLKR